MSNSISIKEGEVTYVINCDQIVYCQFPDATHVIIQFTVGEKLKFAGFTQRDKDALKRAMRIAPA
jgi:hypothetical protein